MTQCERSKQWSARGDVNPLEHGGVWVRQMDGIQVFNVVKVEPEDNGEMDPSWRCHDLSVGLTDGWLDLHAVHEWAEPRDDAQTAISCIEYYGPEEFGGNYNDCTIDSEEEVRKWLTARGVTV